uniref:Expp1 protein n=1 Tax=Nelumbo nucifera TaxID=4432 RepID=A0A822Y4W7_NELNU|nr:TPA_asm: hypothetical protein HUJ06_030452 [Nelumbo nucifera]
MCDLRTTSFDYFSLVCKHSFSAQRKKIEVKMAMMMMMKVVVVVVAVMQVAASDTNRAFQPCSDTKIQRSDGFTFGIAFAPRNSFLYNNSQNLSPCDRRLSLSSSGSSLALFRPKVDEISLLTINTTSNFFPDSSGYMVAFAGRKYAARSPPAFVANSTYIVTSFTLVLEFQKGRLQNFYWKRDGCASCSGNSKFVCLNKQDCAIRTSSCKSRRGSVDCSLGIQLAFSAVKNKNNVWIIPPMQWAVSLKTNVA